MPVIKYNYDKIIDSKYDIRWSFKGGQKNK